MTIAVVAMDRKKVYISAPVSGYDLDERRNFFNDIARRLNDIGYQPVNPMQNGVARNGKYKEHMRADFRLLLDCDFILLCEGWESSAGCQKEATLALWSGIELMPMDEIK